LNSKTGNKIRNHDNLTNKIGNRLAAAESRKKRQKWMYIQYGQIDQEPRSCGAERADSGTFAPLRNFIDHCPEDRNFDSFLTFLFAICYLTLCISHTHTSTRTDREPEKVLAFADCVSRWVCASTSAVWSLGARRRRGFSPELPRATGSRPNQGDFIHVIHFFIEQFFLFCSTCGGRKSSKMRLATDLSSVASGKCRLAAATSRKNQINKIKRKANQN